MDKITETSIENLIQELNSNKYYAIYNSESFYLYKGMWLQDMIKSTGSNITAPQSLKSLSRKRITEFNSMEECMAFFKSGSWKKVKVPQL
jgi:hypothetical protein